MRVKQNTPEYYEVLEILVNKAEMSSFTRVQFKLPIDITINHLYASIDRKFPNMSQAERNKKKNIWESLLTAPYTSSGSRHYIHIINDALHAYLLEIADHTIKEALS
jgi:hypothetical protein